MIWAEERKKKKNAIGSLSCSISRSFIIDARVGYMHDRTTMIFGRHLNNEMMMIKLDDEVNEERHAIFFCFFGF